MSVEKKEIPCFEDGTPLHGDAYFRFVCFVLKKCAIKLEFS